MNQTSTDDGVSDQRLVGTKPAVGGSNYADFHPQTGVNYDPFKEMTFDQRKAAVGGVEGAVQYLEVIATHLAHMMNDEKARTILQRVVPKSDEGEVHLTQILIENPYLLTALSSDFKDNIDDKAIGAQLSQVIGSTESNGEAILKASHEPVGNPDIWLYLTLRIHPDEDIYYEQSWSLVDVDEINVTYTNYDYIRATHGVAYEWNYDYVKEVRIMEGDGFANEDDELGTWGGHPRLIYLGPHPRHRANRLEDYEATGVTQPADAEVVIVRTYDTWDPDDVGR